MTKYNQSFKQQVLEFYLQNGKNRSLIRQHFQLAENTLRRWIKQYNYNGFNGLAILSKKRIYSPEFKLSVVQAVKNGYYLNKGHPSMKPKYPKMPLPPKTEEERLHYRILALEAEVALLKKLQEYNQEMRKKQIS